MGRVGPPGGAGPPRQNRSPGVHPVRAGKFFSCPPSKASPPGVQARARAHREGFICSGAQSQPLAAAAGALRSRQDPQSDLSQLKPKCRAMHSQEKLGDAVELSQLIPRAVSRPIGFARLPSQESQQRSLDLDGVDCSLPSSYNSQVRHHLFIGPLLPVLTKVALRLIAPLARAPGLFPDPPHPASQIANDPLRPQAAESTSE